MAVRLSGTLHLVRSGRHFDLVATRYALEATGGVDTLALTHVDDVLRLGRARVCRAYELDGQLVDRLPVPKAPVDLDAQAELTRRLSGVRPLYERYRRRMS